LKVFLASLLFLPSFSRFAVGHLGSERPFSLVPKGSLRTPNSHRFDAKGNFASERRSDENRSSFEREDVENRLDVFLSTPPSSN